MRNEAITPSAIIFSGYPKSGNTWIEGVLQRIGASVNPLYHQTDIHIARAEGKRFLVHPLIQLDGSPCVVFKSHQQFYSGDVMFPDRKARGFSDVGKAVLIKRNPFDVLLSYLNYAIWHIHHRTRSGNVPSKKIAEYLFDKIGISKSDFEEIVARGDILQSLSDKGYTNVALRIFFDEVSGINPIKDLYGTWFEHTRSWEQQRELDMLVVRYEDLIESRDQVILRLSSFLGLESTILEAGFLGRNEVTMKVVTQDQKERIPSFYNKRTCYYFPNYFEHDLLNEVVTNWASILDECGYPEVLETALK